MLFPGVNISVGGTHLSAFLSVDIYVYVHVHVAVPGKKEHYSVAYFYRVSVFETCTVHVSSSLNFC